METLPAHSLNTKLRDRTLWYDGDSTFREQDVVELLASGVSPDGIWVDSITKDIEQYNKLVSPSEQIKIKKNVDLQSPDWILPEYYANLDPYEFIMDCFNQRYPEDSPINLLRMNRLAQEIVLYKRLKLSDVLRTLIYIINTLNKNNIVWGVGRGSSVSSYVLYIIGVHDVDSVKYELDINDFLK